jgi:HK97 family phage portal protein
MWPFRRKVETRDSLEDLLRETAPQTAAGIVVGADQALRLSAVWGAVRILSETVSTLPAHAFTAGSRDPVDPAPIILRTPAAHTPLHDWLHQVMRSLLLHGNCWGVITQRAGAAFRPTQIELVEPHRIGIQTTPEGTKFRLDGQEIAREELWHLRAYPSAGCLLGLSPIAYAAQTIGLSLAAEKFGSEFFGDGAMPTGVITIGKHITEGQAKETSKLWNLMFNHSTGKRRVGVIGDGGQFNPVSIKPEESQFLEARKLTTQDIARVFGIPPEMLAANSGDSLTYANVEQRSIDFLTYGVGPWLVRLETALTELLPRGQYCRFNAGGLLRTDLKTRYESYAIALQNGFMDVSQIRELEDWGPLEQPAAPARPALEAVA